MAATSVETLDAWNTVLTNIGNLTCGTLPQVTDPHLWSLTDIQAVQNICTSGPDSGSYTTPVGPPYLWKQAIIDEINQAIAKGCCSAWYVKKCICAAKQATVISVQRDPNVAQNLVNTDNRNDPNVAAGVVNYFADTQALTSKCMPACAACTCHPWCYKAQYAPVLLDAGLPNGVPGQLLASTSGVIVSPGCDAISQATTAINNWFKSQTTYWRTARPAATPTLANYTCNGLPIIASLPIVGSVCAGGVLTPYLVGTVGVCLLTHNPSGSGC